jgi:hypothetical protein
VLAVGADGSLGLGATTPAAARNLSGPYRRLGLRRPKGRRSFFLSPHMFLFITLYRTSLDGQKRTARSDRTALPPVGLSVHPVVGLNDNATLEAAAAAGATFAADALAL